MDEAKAVAQLKAGNVAALQTLVELYQVKAVQAAVLVTRDRALAEEVVQNAFVRSVERIRQFDASRPFRPWFLRVVVNDALKAVARQGRYVPLDSFDDRALSQVVAWLEATAHDPEDDVQRNERQGAVQEALAALSPRQRAAVVLYYYVGLNERETASQMGCATGTVKWHLHVARERLRALLSAWAT